MSATAFTRARSMGPVAEMIERSGGSIARVFRQAELPLRLIERPDQLILLRDQLALVECAAREIGDETLPLRLSLDAGFARLGAFGQRIGAAPVLEDAIRECNATIGSTLQSMTHMRLSRGLTEARWSYEISDPARVGRQKNELLAFGYMADVLRRFVGRAPARAELPCKPQAKSRLQDLLGCEIASGETAALFFPAAWLEAENPGFRASEGGQGDPMPQDLGASVEQLIKLGVLENKATIEWARRRLGMSARNLQRKLAVSGESFETIRARALKALAIDMLSHSKRPITDIAYELGYSDAAHFSRAFSSWTGRSPRQWRRGP